MQYKHAKGRKHYAFLVLTILLIGLFILNISLGSVYIPFQTVVKWMLGFPIDNEIWQNILLKSRFPTAITALLAGAGLAAGGLQMQTLFRNPLAGPSILGISSGAGLGVAIVVLLLEALKGISLSSLGWFGSLTITGAAFAGAFWVLFMVLFLARKLKNNAMLLIVGIMVGYASSAIVGLLQFISSKEDVQAFVIWGLGSFNNLSWEKHVIFIPMVLVGLIGSLFLIKPLNVLLLGENYAANLGLNIKRSRFSILIVTGLLTATVTAFCGPVAFLGLAVPHLCKGIFKTADHSILIPGVILFGGVLALLCHLIARLPGLDGTLPINAVTSLIGAPIVVYVILKRRSLIQ
ncbi:iron ABC transporter permease [Saccharicrinis fermentans]|uniref:Putative ABC transporter permease protein n=1 Tax=Saccharicrinis fermentans DSM 9555 = JCM 21142 TaxID=869213 RepID=W7YFY3_9BACT|nr:iron ABC transporter permease [Saccharicrinis fermentans]GAF01504.1 putative ABC transporter permease protein [Saccharicrinis fermentans DSM 9555 = JCM 21142]